MRLAIVALALLLEPACKSVQGDDYPITPGGPGPGGTGSGHDAGAVDASDGGETISGRACLLMDARDLGSCAPAGAGGLVVTLGTGTATTADDGSFTIAPTIDTNARWHIADTVAGADIVTTIMENNGVTTIPVIATQKAVDILSGSGIVANPVQGSIIVQVAQAGAALQDAEVTALPAPDSPTLYDTADPLLWNGLATGAHGMAWIPNAQPGAASLTITPLSGTPVTVPAIAVEMSAIVFVTTTLP